MKKYGFILAAFIFQFSPGFATAKPHALKVEPLKVETLKIKNSKFTIRFFGPAEFCDYDSISIQKNGKNILTLKKRCGREVKESGPSIVAGGEWVKAVKLGPDTSDIYLLFAEEPQNDVYQTTLVTVGDKPAVAFSSRIAGKFQDYNGDGLLDLLKEGGHGEPTGKTSSYDPYLVYVQSKKDGKIDFTLNEELSKKFSAENHFEWHGPKYDESIQVNQDGH